MTYDVNIIGNIISKERKKLGYTQRKLGSLLNITNKQICVYESGKTCPPIDVLFDLCKIFNCELGYLLGEESYSNGTKFQTAVNEFTGLSSESISSIKRITGKEKNCLNFGYNSQKNRSVLNKFISSPEFFVFFDALQRLDEEVSKSNKIFADLESSLGKDLFNEALDLYNSSVDYEYGDYKIRPELANALAELEHAETKTYEQAFPIRLSRYELNEAFSHLINTIYPK